MIISGKYIPPYSLKFVMFGNTLKRPMYFPGLSKSLIMSGMAINELTT